MRMIRQVAGFSALWISLIGFAGPVWGSVLKTDSQGMILPFKVKEMRLHEFAREYAQITRKILQTDGPWEASFKGEVTLFIPRAITQEKLTEIFHHVLAENGFSVIDAPMDAGWIITRIRDARDLTIPVYTEQTLPDTRRLVTVMYSLRHTSAEEVARVLRSFMPTSSRILPFARSQLAITDSGHNIHPKLTDLIHQLDTEEAADLLEKDRKERSSRPVCKPKEQKIETLRVEKVEISEMTSPSGDTPSPLRSKK